MNNYFINTPGVNWRGLTIGECNNAVIRNNTVYGYGANGIWNAGADNTIIDGNTLYKNNSDGIVIGTLTTTSDNVIIKNNIITDCHSSCGSSYAIKISSGSSATLSNNDTYNYAGGNISGSYTDGGNNVSIDPTYLSTTSTASNFLFIDPTSSLYTVGVGGIPMGGRYVAIPSNLRQFKDSDSTSQISAGGFTDEKSIIFKADLSTTTFSSLTPEIEIKPLDRAFDATTNISTGGSPIYLGSTVTSNDQISCLGRGSYHWRMRAKNSADVYSDWVVFGGNSDGNPPTTNADRDFSLNNDCFSDSNYSTRSGYTLKFNLGDPSKNLTDGRYVIKGENDSKAQLIVDKDGVIFDTLAIIKKISDDDLSSGNNPDKIKYKLPEQFNYKVVGDYWDYRLYSGLSGIGLTGLGGKMTIQIPYELDAYSIKNLKIIALDKLKNRWTILPYSAVNADQSTIGHVVDNLSIYTVAIVPTSAAINQAPEESNPQSPQSSIPPNPTSTPILTPTIQPTGGVQETSSKKCFWFLCF